MVTQIHRELDDGEISRLATTYKAWTSKSSDYNDEIGFCKSATIEEVQKHKFTLAPGRYVGFKDDFDTDESSAERISKAVSSLQTRAARSSELTELIGRNLSEWMRR